MQTIYKDLRLHRFGQTPGLSLETLARDLGGAFQIHALADRPLATPRNGLDAGRGQYPTAIFLKTLAAMNVRGEPAAAGNPGRTARLGITAEDLFVPRLSFVFGEADPQSDVAVISTHRLRPEFYGQEPDLDRFQKRILKEAVHELGHVFGLSHCHSRMCIMHFSNTVEDTDLKGPGFCRECQVRLALRGLGRNLS